MKTTLGLAMPDSTKAKMAEMAGNLNHSQFLHLLLNKHADAALHAEKDPIQKTSYFLDEDDVAILDAIVTRNKLKSRNQAITLLIEHAWKQKNQQTQPESPNS